mmetsp:Transcript_104758/g.305875  ORF Transcript_104758/g.305875 Transcript_104758/m.305875 type:complete len:205 (-) Transcript_104758:749-1363(-)
MVSYKQSMALSSEPKKYSSSSMCSISSSPSLCCTLWSVTSCVRKTPNTKVNTNRRKSVQARDRRESAMETTSMRKPPNRYSMRVSRKRRTSLNRRKMRMALSWFPATFLKLCAGSRWDITLIASSRSCMLTTSKSNVFQCQPGSVKNPKPETKNRTTISTRKMAQKSLSTARKTGGLSVHQLAAMYCVSMPMTTAFRRMIPPMR